MKKVLPLIILFLLSTAPAMAYENVPALLYVNGKKQNDTVGFNIATAMVHLCYEKIMSGEATLYDSPKKLTIISADALKTLEKTSQTVFISSTDLFIHEYWSSNKKRSFFELVGFTFINKDPYGNKHTYGYIDASELRNILENNFIPVNVNGTYLTNYWNALHSRRYEYSLVQFGSDDFKKKPERSFDIKAEAFYSNKAIENIVLLSKTKHIVYEVEKDELNENSMANHLINGLERFLNTNREEFFNLGGSAIISHLKKNAPPLRISKLQITEIARQIDGRTVYMPAHIVIIINGKALQPLSFEQIETWQLYFNFKSVTDICKEKKFDLLITKINSIPIEPSESEYYRKALKNYSWTRMTDYVRSLKLN